VCVKYGWIIYIIYILYILSGRVSPQGGEAVVINRTQRQRSEADGIFNGRGVPRQSF
jgi:hypothetical protein